METDQWGETLSRTHDVVRQFARVEFDRLARKAVWQLQRIEASGVYGNDYKFKTLWDEYCYEIQYGPSILAEDAWKSMIDAVLHEIVEEMPDHMVILLSISAIFYCDDDDNPELIGRIAMDSLKDAIKSALGSIASDRSLERFIDSE